MKKAIVMILVLAFVLVLAMTGCAPAAPAASSEAPAASSSAAVSEAPAASSEAPAASSEAPKTEKLYLGLAIRSLTNPYYIQLIDGANMFAEWLKGQGQDCEVVTLVSDGSDDKQVSGVKDFIAAHGKNCVVVVDPNNAPTAAPIAEYAEENGVYWSTTWSTAEGLKIKDYKYYVFHQTLDDETSGYSISKAMFDSFATPGTGKILAIQGMLANSAAIGRFKGLQKALAEYPNIELLADQAGDWDPQKAYTIAETWLTKYKDIQGIWVANDSMALSVIELLKSKGLNGKIKVCGVDGIDDAVKAVDAGDMVATVFSNPYKQGGLGLNLLYNAWAGKIVPSDLELGKRCFLTEGLLVTKDTVAKMSEKPKFDYADIWQIVYKPLDIPLVQD